MIACIIKHEKNRACGTDWATLFAAFIILTVTVGIRNSLGVSLEDISGGFGWNRVQTTTAFTMGMIGEAMAPSRDG